MSSLTDTVGSSWVNRSGAALEAWLTLDGPRMMCDAEGRLHWSNPRAMQLLNASPTLALRDGILVSLGRGGPSLPELLAASPDRIGTHVVCGSEGEAAVLITVRAVQWDGGALRGLTLRQIGDRPVYAWPDMSHVFRLTGAERKIAQGMAEGETAEDIADRTRLSVETVRTHIRHIYSKMGVSSRGELFSRLSPFMIWDE